MNKVQMGYGKKGAYHDYWSHGNPSIAQAYFIGLKARGEQKFRLLDENGNIIAQKRAWQ